MMHMRNQAPGTATGESTSPKMAELYEAHPWHATSLGPKDQWPETLLTLADVVLSSLQPMCIVWGEKRALIYNDGYAEILAAKHPQALGRDILEVWREIEANLTPIVAQAYAGQPVHMRDIALLMERRGFQEEAHFAFSYTPLRLGGGRVEGFLCVLLETTREVADEQRRSFLYDLDRQMRELLEPAEIVAFAQRRLGEYLSASRVGYGEVDATERYFTTSDNWTDGSVPSRHGTHDLAAFGPEIYGALRRGDSLVVHDVCGDPRTNSTEARAAFAAIDTSAALTASLVKEGRMRAALYVHCREPRRWSPEDTSIVDAVAERTWSAVERARAEEGLRRERDRLRNVLENMAEGFLLLDRDFRVLQINAEGLRLEQGEASAIVGRSHWEVWPGIESSEIGRLYQKAMADRLPVALEHRYVWQDGTSAWIDTRAYPTADGLAIFYRDISARKAAEARSTLMLELVDKLRSGSAAEALEAASALIGRHFGCTRVGYGDLDAARNLFNYQICWTDGTVPPLVGQYPAHAFGAEIVARLAKGETVAIADVRSDPAAAEPDAQATSVEVDTRSILVVPFLHGDRLRGIFYVNDRPVRAWSEADIGLVEEVAERIRQLLKRHEAELALKRLNATLEAQVAEKTADRDRMWRLSTDLMLVARFDSTITAINPAWTSLLGWSEQDLVGAPFIDLVHPEDVEATLAEAGKLADGLSTLRFENRYRHRDGSYRWLSWTAVPGESLIHAVARDISAEKVAAAELALVQDALRQSQKLEAMGQLTGGVAHDFNNLLTPIIGVLDMLQRRGGDNGRVQRLITGGLQSAERARTLVQRLLAFARRQPLQPEPVDVRELVDGMAELVASTLGPRIALEVNLPRNLPPALADRNQLEMAILNLAVNARDAMLTGGVLNISAFYGEERHDHRVKLAPGGYVRLSVADTGTGMDEATAARAVEPFFSTKGVGKGTGLGLSMVHGLAAQLGGTLTIDTALGVGTRIDLWLPLAHGRVAREQHVANVQPLSRPGKALLVDDEELVRASTANMLSELGYEVVEVSSAEEALARLGEGLAPSLLVTDQLMPGMTGTELHAELRARGIAVPTLLVSGYADDLEQIDIPHLSKPFRLGELAERVRQIV